MSRGRAVTLGSRLLVDGVPRYVVRKQSFDGRLRLAYAASHRHPDRRREAVHPHPSLATSWA
jgi:hypothetical protein